MKQHYKDRMDETRNAYLNALQRLKNGNPTHTKLVGQSYKINAQTLALEAGKSRNPLYNTHKDILDMIEEVKIEETGKRDKKKEDRVSILQNKIKDLQEENRKLLSINAMLLLKIKD